MSWSPVCSQVKKQIRFWLLESDWKWTDINQIFIFCDLNLCLCCIIISLKFVCLHIFHFCNAILTNKLTKYKIRKKIRLQQTHQISPTHTNIVFILGFGEFQLLLGMTSHYSRNKPWSQLSCLAHTTSMLRFPSSNNEVSIEGSLCDPTGLLS